MYSLEPQQLDELADWVARTRELWAGRLDAIDEEIRRSRRETDTIDEELSAPAVGDRQDRQRDPRARGLSPTPPKKWTEAREETKDDE
jgi:predicted transcriptional regulator